MPSNRRICVTYVQNFITKGLRKQSDRGYWVSKLFYYQSISYYFLYCIRFLSIHFYAATNPAIKYGGMLDDRKSDIYKLLPPQWIPKTKLITNQNDTKQTNEEEIGFPLIIKPDIGFKGFLVAKLDNEDQLAEYKQLYGSKDFLLQEYVDFQREFSILIYRYPKHGEVGVSSFIEKTYPEIVGDGLKTIEQLINEKQNPFLKKKWIKDTLQDRLSNVLEKGKSLRIDTIGNYSRGSKFHSLNESIDEELIDWAKNLFDHIDGIDFCRLDLKADSVTEMKKGKFTILELNGVKSEPLHIYDPKYSVPTIIKDVHIHWMILTRIVKERIQLSYKMPPLLDGVRSWWIAKNLVK